MATIIKITGKHENIEPDNGKVFTLEELQKAVDGYIQIVLVNLGNYDGKLMIVNEEGKLKTDAKLNEEASRIAGQPVVGQVIVIDRAQIE